MRLTHAPIVFNLTHFGRRVWCAMVAENINPAIVILSYFRALKTLLQLAKEPALCSFAGTQKYYYNSY